MLQEHPTGEPTGESTQAAMVDTLAMEIELFIAVESSDSDHARGYKAWQDAAPEIGRQAILQVLHDRISIAVRDLAPGGNLDGIDSGAWPTVESRAHDYVETLSSSAIERLVAANSDGICTASDRLRATVTQALQHGLDEVTVAHDRPLTCPMEQLEMAAAESKDSPAYCFLQNGEEVLCVAGMQAVGIQSSELFLDRVDASERGRPQAVLALCRGRWVALADTLASYSEAVELYFLLHNQPTSGRIRFSVLMACRAGDAEAAIQGARGVWPTVRRLLCASLDYMELTTLERSADLRRLLGTIVSGSMREISRRTVDWSLPTPAVSTACKTPYQTTNVGFTGDGSLPCHETAGADETASATLWIAPWEPSEDTWQRLLNALLQEPDRAAWVVHFRGMREAPASTRALTHEASTAMQSYLENSQMSDTMPGIRECELRRDLLLRREHLHSQRIIAARLFLVTARQPSPALAAIVECSLHDVASDTIYHGGTALRPASRDDVLASLAEPTLEQIYGLKEASAFLRTPLPVPGELPGMDILRARTAELAGSRGRDITLGVNVHLGTCRDVAMDESTRFRHTYIIGQTGTGKSTLLTNLILGDVRRGRGVCVLDPHGELIDTVLAGIPAEREQDVVLIDLTDTDYPVALNPLCLPELAPPEYRLARDILIDDLYAYLHRTYDMKNAGGPMFESYYRNGMQVLFGSEYDLGMPVPTFLLHKLLYADRRFMNAMSSMRDSQATGLEDWTSMIMRAKGDSNLDNVAPYIVSKFERFTNDSALRNITCQNRTLDLDAIVRERKILLFHLGSGRFGEYSAGLLAYHLVSKLRLAIMKRRSHDTQHHAPFYLYADEFQLFADGRFAELLAECRKFGLGITMAHQYTDQLPNDTLKAIIGNVGTIISLRVGASDARKLEHVFEPTFRSSDLSSLANFHAYVRSFGNLGPTPFSLRILPPPAPGDAQSAVRIRQRSRVHFAAPREQAEAEIAATYSLWKDLT